MTSADTITLQEAASLSSHERGLVVVSTLRANGTIQSSLVNAGVLAHPATGETILPFVAAGPIKLANMRARPQVTATFRNGWQWAAVEGRAELAGPDDPQPWLDAEGLRLLLRAIFAAAGLDSLGAVAMDFNCALKASTSCRSRAISAASGGGTVC